MQLLPLLMRNRRGLATYICLVLGMWCPTCVFEYASGVTLFADRQDDPLAPGVDQFTLRLFLPPQTNICRHPLCITIACMYALQHQLVFKLWCIGGIIIGGYRCTRGAVLSTLGHCRLYAKVVDYLRNLCALEPIHGCVRLCPMLASSLTYLPLSGQPALMSLCCQLFSFLANTYHHHCWQHSETW
jgi:hypothetical protein